MSQHVPLAAADPEAAQVAIATNTAWYHTIDVAPGVSTPGAVDVRALPQRLFPNDLSGLRTLDVGTYDGFWAFAMEARGASVHALDLAEFDASEWPPRNRERLLARAQEWSMELGRGFSIASTLLGSSAVRVPCDVYELLPETIGGPVDFAFLGAMLLHLRNPVAALEAILGALKPGGRLVMLEPFSKWNTLIAPRTPIGRFEPLRSDFNWWLPNLSALKAWVWAAGFDDVRRTGFHRVLSDKGPPLGGRYVSIAARRPES